MKRILLSILAAGILLLSSCRAPTPAPPTTCTLSVTVSPSGAGSVSPSEGKYEKGTQVTLTATSVSGYTFSYWGGDASGSLATTTIIVDSDKSITAHFAIVPPTTYTLSVTVSPSGAGSVSPSEGKYEKGTQVTLTATPANDYTFSYWGGDASGSLATTTITMNSDKSVSAHFGRKAPPPATTKPSPPAVTQKDVDDARQVVLKYWDAFNAFDAERTLTYLEESYRREREESLRGEINLMKLGSVLRRIKIGVEEEAQPVITPEGAILIKMKLDTPQGDKHITYKLVKVSGEWKIKSAD